MKNQGENKNRNNKFHSREFIYFTADVIGPSYDFHILLSNIYNIYNIEKFWEDKVLRNLGKIMQVIHC